MTEKLKVLMYYKKIICFISVVVCTFIIEPLAFKNAILKQENSKLEEAIKENRQEQENLLGKEEKTKEQNDKEKNNEWTRIIRGRNHRGE